MTLGTGPHGGCTSKMVLLPQPIVEEIRYAKSSWHQHGIPDLEYGASITSSSCRVRSPGSKPRLLPNRSRRTPLSSRMPTLRRERSGIGKAGVTDRKRTPACAIAVRAFVLEDG